MHTITTFGGVEVRSENGGLQRFRSRKHVALLVYVRSSPRRVHLRERLVDLFWETESSLARHSLSQALYDLRSNLGQVILNCPGDAVRVKADRLGFDVEKLERAIKQGELSVAISAYAGRFAPDLDRAGTEVFQDWLEHERARLSVLGQTALRQFLEYADSRGEWGEMCSASLRLIKMNPLDEAAHRALMRGLWLHGDQASALEHFEEIRERLDHELPEGLSEETLELVERIKGSPPEANFEQKAAAQLPPLVGRGSELKKLSEFVEQRATSPETLVIQGEAGIGKTRLVQELEKRLTLEGFELLRSQCYAAEAEVAYGPVLDGLRNVVEAIGDLPGCGRYQELGRLFPSARQERDNSVRIPSDGQSARRRLFEELADILRRYCEKHKIVWVVEDIHCLDGASSALFHYLARRLAAEPFRLALSTRPPSEQGEPAQKLLTEEYFVDNAKVVPVQPLQREAVAKLLESITAVGRMEKPIVEKINTLSGGNPFFVVELANSLDSDPHLTVDRDLYTGKLRAILNTRLRGLNAVAGRVLEALCVIYPHSTPEVLRKILHIDSSRLSAATEELAARNIIEENDGKFVFVHELLRKFVYSDLGLVNRSTLHLAAAEVLAGTEMVSSSTVAVHFGEGGDSVRAYEHAAKAAKEADRRSGCEEAISIAAYGAKNAPSPADRFTILKLLAQAQVNCGSYRAAIGTYKQLLKLASSEALEAENVQLKLSLAETYVELAEWKHALKALMAVESYILDPHSQNMALKHQVEFLRLRITTAVWSKERERASQEAAELGKILASAQGEVSAGTRVRAVHALGIYETFCGSLSLAQECLVAAEPLLSDCEDPEVAGRLMVLRGGVEIKLGNWDSAEYWLNRSLNATKERHDVLTEAKTYNNLACLALEKGDWLSAKSYLNKTIQLCGTFPKLTSVIITAKLNYAKVYLYEGNYPKALRCYRELGSLLAIHERKLSYFEAEIRGGVGLAALSCGKIELALQQWRIVSKLQAADLSIVQESFVVYWLEAFLQYLGVGGKDVKRLETVIERIEAKDRVAAMKLRWINEVLSKDVEEEPGGYSPALEKQMKEEGLYWFMRFFNRWLEVARSNLRSTKHNAFRKLLSSS